MSKGGNSKEKKKVSGPNGTCATSNVMPLRAFGLGDEVFLARDMVWGDVFFVVVRGARGGRRRGGSRWPRTELQHVPEIDCVGNAETLAQMPTRFAKLL